MGVLPGGRRSHENEHESAVVSGKVPSFPFRSLKRLLDVEKNVELKAAKCTAYGKVF